MVDAKQVIPFKRFVEFQGDKIRLYSTEFNEQLLIQTNGKSIQKVAIEQGLYKGNGTPFYALYGYIHLKKSSYLMFVTKANLIGQILQRKILQVEEISYLPLYPGGVMNNIANEDLEYVAMLKSIINTKTLYFSHEYDLSNSISQMLANASSFSNQFFTSESLIYNKIPNKRFTYNYPLVSFLEDIGSQSALQYWQSVFISGTVMIKYCRLSSFADCNFILISRRENLRSGKRFVQRGCDDDGNCTNFAETEQIIILDRKDVFLVNSFVQTRGSMPFRWKQTPSLKWSPKADILGDKSYNGDLCKKHFQQQMKIYPQQILINLIDKKGTQKKLGDYYTQLISYIQNPKIKYIWFDFHHECRNMKYENLSKLLNQITEELKKGGYFVAEIPKNNVNVIQKVIQTQSGVCRTNCMDCLDRTNVVQGVVARNILLNILFENKIIAQLSGEAFQPLPSDLENIFRDLWTRNADVMSFLYSGTGALKTDFTRTGKRTFQGSLQDGKNSVMRYVINNFYDGDNQNSVDLILGKIDLTKQQIKKPKFQGLHKFVFLFILLTFLFASYAPQYIISEETSGITYFIVQTFVLLIGGFISFRALQTFNKQFIQKPVVEQ